MSTTQGRLTGWSRPNTSFLLSLRCPENRFFCPFQVLLSQSGGEKVAKVYGVMYTLALASSRILPVPVRHCFCPFVLPLASKGDGRPEIVGEIS